MAGDLFFREVFCALWLVFLAHLSWVRFSARQPTKSGLIEEHADGVVGRGLRTRTVLLAMLGPFWFGGILLYVVYPGGVFLFSVSLPDWLRLMMTGVAVLSLPLLAWSYHALGKNWVHCMNPSAFLHKKEHALVTNGPYRYVRHPLYATSFLFILSLALVAANWLVLLPTVAVTALVCALTGEEEAMLIRTFGDEYRKYMKRTPRFIPNPGFLGCHNDQPKPLEDGRNAAAQKIGE